MRFHLIMCAEQKTKQDSKGPGQPHLCFCLRARVWLLYFYSEHVETNEITVKLLKIIKNYFRNTTYSKIFSNQHQ